MKVKAILLAFLASSFPLTGSVEHSIIPYMNQLIHPNCKEKLHPDQREEIAAVSSSINQRVRVMSFNMLLNYSDAELEPEHRWEKRKERLIEYLKWSDPDLIGSQELQSDQLENLLSVLGNVYSYFGVGVIDGEKKGDIHAIFYRKDRFDLLKGQTYYFSETPGEVSSSPFGGKNTFTYCRFSDKKSGKEFIVANTHLAFKNIKRRFYEAIKLREFLLVTHPTLPLILTGDFNTFPYRQDLDVPFYDGDKVVALIESGNLRDSMRHPVFGHFGPIATTNFCITQKKPFVCEGTPGVILDRIFVNDGIQVLTHAVDPAQIDGHYISDHFPVVVDLLIKETKDQLEGAKEQKSKRGERFFNTKTQSFE